MTFLKQAVHHPRKLWLRKAVFQVHLWAGLLLTLYVVVIALTGSILVFEDELTGTTLPAAIARDLTLQPLPIPDVVANVLRAYPEATVDLVTVPTRDVPAYLIEAKLRGGRVQTMIADPATGIVYTQNRTWVQWVHDLHVYLLLNPAYGMQVNAAGAAVLLLLTVTGLMLWWPGLRVWSRGMRVNLRANWRRMNYDLHSAIGFWTLLLVFWWALLRCVLRLLPAGVDGCECSVSTAQHGRAGRWRRCITGKARPARDRTPDGSGRITARPSLQHQQRKRRR